MSLGEYAKTTRSGLKLKPCLNNSYNCVSVFQPGPEIFKISIFEPFLSSFSLASNFLTHISFKFLIPDPKVWESPKTITRKTSLDFLRL